jgi:hypothetical protein
MCCFAQPVDSVSRTRIFGRLTKQKSQFVAYQMRYASKLTNAMILPVPIQANAKKRPIRFIDLSAYPAFFRHLERGFPKPKSIIESRTVESAPQHDSLRVHKVGQFEASFVPTINHFQKLDPRFSISKSIWSKVPDYSDYGFVVFQLHELSGEPHPMAFEFNTRLTDTIFLPTIHIHDGEVHRLEKFDHTMYVQNSDLDLAAGDYQGHKLWDLKSGWARSYSSAEKFIDVKRANDLIAGDLKVHRKNMKGTFANEDQFISRKNLTTSSLGSTDSLSLSTTLAVGSVGLGSLWFLNRRERVMANATKHRN